jgi:hypothetical protein
LRELPLARLDEGVEEGPRLVVTAAQNVEPGEPALVAADDLAVD